MKILKEPFVQFLLIGAAVFAASYLFTDSPDEGKVQIVISSQTVQTMRNRLQKRFESRLSAEEIEAKFNEELDYVIRQEILYREGLARNLDKDDSVVKNRVASKMERFAKEMASSESFTEGQIEKFYNENKQLFTSPKRISFRQTLFGSEERGREQALADCQEVLARIQAGELKEYSELEKLADRNAAIRGEFDNTTIGRIAAVFGKEFAEILDRDGQEGRMIAPVASKHGCHIVEIRKVVPARLKPLGEVRNQVESKLEYERNAKAFLDFYDGIKGNYDVVVEDGR